MLETFLLKNFITFHIFMFFLSLFFLLMVFLLKKDLTIQNILFFFYFVIFFWGTINLYNLIKILNFYSFVFPYLLFFKFYF